MTIKQKIKEIEDALDAMVASKDSGESFGKLKKAVVDRIRETEESADAMLGLDRNDVSEDIRAKLKEVGTATDSLLNLEDEAQSKQVGDDIRLLIDEITNASEVMISGNKPKE